MAPRVRTDSLLWVFCCCGGVPLIGLAKGLVTCLPMALMCTLSVAFTSLLWLPHDVWHSYHTALRVQFLGPNLRVLAMVLLPVPLLLWPALATLAALLVSFLAGLFLPALQTFSDQTPLWTGGVVDTLQQGWQAVRSFWTFNAEAVFGFLTQLRTRPLGPGEAPFDVSLAQILVALLVALLGLLTVGLLGTVVATLYLLPVTLRCFYLLWELYGSAFQGAFVGAPDPDPDADADAPRPGSERGCGRGRGIRAGARSRSLESQLWVLMALPLWVAANVVLPLVLLLAYALLVLCCLGYGVSAASISYRHSVKAACAWMLRPPCQLERAALEWIWGSSSRPSGLHSASKGKRSLLVTKCIEPLARTVDDQGLKDPLNARI